MKIDLKLTVLEANIGLALSQIGIPDSMFDLPAIGALPARRVLTYHPTDAADLDVIAHRMATFEQAVEQPNSFDPIVVVDNQPFELPTEAREQGDGWTSVETSVGVDDQPSAWTKHLLSQDHTR